jgi:hypothetical protein
MADEKTLLLANQRILLQNQRKLDSVISNQGILKRIFDNQKIILKNQKRILTGLR